MSPIVMNSWMLGKIIRAKIVKAISIEIPMEIKW